MYPDKDKEPPEFDLSELTKLKNAWFSHYRTTQKVQWITATLNTAKSTNLQEITIQSPYDFVTPTDESVNTSWLDLDRLLIQWFTSRSIRPEIMFQKQGVIFDYEKGVEKRLLPRLTKAKEGFITVYY